MRRSRRYEEKEEERRMGRRRAWLRSIAI